jgi:uncharacterized protein (TIGR02246 family)
MKPLAIICASASLVLVMAACSTPPPDTHDADVRAIQDTETQWNQDYSSKDINKIAAHYADDAILMVPGGPSTSGKEAIQKSLQQMVADPAMALKFESTRVDVAKSGDLAYTRGTYTFAFTDPQTHKVINDHGSYVTAYRKELDGTWKAVADIATSEVPPAAPAPPPPATKKK